ncbi:MAG: LysE family transporter, partial [Roseibium sp.]|uniref:LysE family translocator n=1 Tax=Roseibium sp. TaxID=1936156 RepID=UPI0026121084
MSFELWIAFVAASAALLAIPGPTITIVVGYAISSGRSAVWATTSGVVLGDFTAMTASLLGAGAVLAASATLFTALKFAGALYLIWLGIKLWRSKPD